MELEGKIISQSSGFYTVLFPDNSNVRCVARGLLRKNKITPLVGDNVTVCINGNSSDFPIITSVMQRRNFLIRPPIANIDTLFIVLSPVSPEPNLFYTDKLICHAINTGIVPVPVITKADSDEEKADELYKIYSPSFRTFLTSSVNNSGIDRLFSYISDCHGICAFSGASGVGKSTLINTLFKGFTLETGFLSDKTDRGRHTTRSVNLFKTGDGSFIADTPGFSLIDSGNLGFIGESSVPLCFPEFEPFLFKCRYRDCSHTKEEDCAVISAVEKGIIPLSRFSSYLRLMQELKK